MEIRKSIDEFGYKQYGFVKDNKIFKILFRGNGDLYWSLINLDIDEDKDYDTFTISIDDSFELFTLFEKLYLNIKNANVYENVSLFGYDYLDAFELNQKRKDESKLWSKKVKERENYKDLFDGEKITWISDDRDYDKDQVVQISKKDNTFILEFARKDKLDNGHFLTSHNTSSIIIRFRNSGSSYDPFNLVFMEMYNALNKLSFGKNQINEIEGQIHINDCLSLKKN